MNLVAYEEELGRRMSAFARIENLSMIKDGDCNKNREQVMLEDCIRIHDEISRLGTASSRQLANRLGINLEKLWRRLERMRDRGEIIDTGLQKKNGSIIWRVNDGRNSPR